MGYNSSFFNGVEYDAGAVNNRFAALFSDGILVDGHIIGNALAVTLKTGMTLTVAPGRCQIYGALLEVTGSGEDLVVSAADSDNPRIDTVVVEYNLDTDINTARVAIVQGTPAVSPEDSQCGALPPPAPLKYRVRPPEPFRRWLTDILLSCSWLWIFRHRLALKIHKFFLFRW